MCSCFSGGSSESQNTATEQSEVLLGLGKNHLCFTQQPRLGQKATFFLEPSAALGVPGVRQAQAAGYSRKVRATCLWGWVLNALFTATVGTSLAAVHLARAPQSHGGRRNNVGRTCCLSTQGHKGCDCPAHGTLVSGRQARRGRAQSQGLSGFQVRSLDRCPRIKKSLLAFSSLLPAFPLRPCGGRDPDNDLEDGPQAPVGAPRRLGKSSDQGQSQG